MRRVLFCMAISVLVILPSVILAATLLYDEFDGYSLGPWKWHIPTWLGPDDGTFVGRTQFRCAQNSPLPEVREGNVIIKLESHNPTGFSFYGTDLISNESFSLGKGIHITVRARMKTATRGIVGGIFLYALKPGSKTVHDEIGFELLTNSTNGALTNIYGNEPLGAGHPQSISYPSGSITDYHTYEIIWRSNQVSWLIDGNLVRTATRPVPTGGLPLNLHLNIWAPDTEWAEAYDPGIQPTADSGKNQIFEMWVDSVNVQSINASTDLLGDFNGDGHADILWRHASTGKVYIWMMDGTAVVDQGSPATVADLDWRIEGVGDFNGDGRADVLWRHALTGKVYIWVMNGTAVIGQGSPGTVPDSGWMTQGIVDFNKDNKTDILWRHASTGQIHVWIMNGPEIIAQGSPGIAADLSWKMQGLGDFDGDGNGDILWRHASMGTIYIWFMKGAAVINQGSPGTVADLDWKIEGTGDLNGDGSADILWRHAYSGMGYVWMMSGTAVIGQGSPGTVTDMAYIIQGLGDFNGDGNADILWQHTTLGILYVWMMDGNAVVAQGSPARLADLGWKISAPQRPLQESR